MVKWEYLVLDISESAFGIKEILDGYGEGGWELVSVAVNTVVDPRYPHRIKFFLKRQKHK